MRSRIKQISSKRTLNTPLELLKGCLFYIYIENDKKDMLHALIYNNPKTYSYCTRINLDILASY